jgi:hypothetical protein
MNQPTLDPAAEAALKRAEAEDRRRGRRCGLAPDEVDQAVRADHRPVVQRQGRENRLAPQATYRPRLAVHHDVDRPRSRTCMAPHLPGETAPKTRSRREAAGYYRQVNARPSDWAWTEKGVIATLMVHDLGNTALQEGGLGSERGLATPSPDAKGREPSALSMSIMPQEP